MLQPEIVWQRRSHNCNATNLQCTRGTMKEMQLYITPFIGETKGRTRKLWWTNPSLQWSRNTSSSPRPGQLSSEEASSCTQVTGPRGFHSCPASLDHPAVPWPSTWPASWLSQLASPWHWLPWRKRWAGPSPSWCGVPPARGTLTWRPAFAVAESKILDLPGVCSVRQGRPDERLINAVWNAMSETGG